MRLFLLQQVQELPSNQQLRMKLSEDLGSSFYPLRKLIYASVVQNVKLSCEEEQCCREILCLVQMLVMIALVDRLGNQMQLLQDVD